MGVMIIFGVITSQNASKYATTYGSTINQPSFSRFETIFPLVIFAIVFGMRYDVGVDHLSYLENYIWQIDNPKFELIFSWITKICRSLNFHYSIYFAILAFIQVFFFFYAFKDERYLFPFLVLFLFANGEWLNWMNIIRQSIAMCIWIYSIKFIEKKKFWLYLFWCIIAFFFHRSAIILIIFYPILRNGKDYFKSIPLQLLLLAAAFAIKNIFFDIILKFSSIVDFYISLLGTNIYEYGYNIDRLLESFGEQKGTGVAYIFKIIVNVIIILYSTKLKKFFNSKRFNIIYFFYFFGLITLYMFPIGAISFTRPFRYFYIFQTIMLAYFAYYLSHSNIKVINNKILAYILIVCYLGIFYLNHILATPDSHLWYQFYFQH